MKLYTPGTFFYTALVASTVLLCALAPSTYNRVQPVTLNKLHEQVKTNNDTLYVVNFWATWCKPCVEEMPYFINAAGQYAHQPFKLIFVSLNSPKELAAVQKFTDSRNITQPVLLLTETNANVWINRVDSTWTGSIPATAFYRKGQKLLFYEGELDASGLDSLLLKYIKP